MRLGFAVLALLLVSVTSANAQVTSVQVTPSPAIVGQPATVTVTGGAAPCGAVQINYGDGAPTTYPISGLPFVQSHTWIAAGSYPVVATGQGNCTGEASVTLTVGRSNRGTKIGVSPNTGIHIAMRIKLVLRRERARRRRGNCRAGLRAQSRFGRRETEGMERRHQARVADGQGLEPDAD